jgi:hypothetical protein
VSDSFIVEMVVKRTKPPREDSRYPDYDILTQFTLPADGRRAFGVYRAALIALTEDEVRIITGIEEQPT